MAIINSRLLIFAAKLQKMDISYITIAPVDIIYLRSEKGIVSAGQCFGQFSEKIQHDWAQRQCIGLSYMDGEGLVYEAAATVKNKAEAENFGLDSKRLMGGLHAATMLKNWRTDTANIGKSFEALEKEVDMDNSRPFLEIYVNENDVMLLIPVHDKKEALN